MDGACGDDLHEELLEVCLSEQFQWRFMLRSTELRDLDIHWLIPRERDVI